MRRFRDRPCLRTAPIFAFVLATLAVVAGCSGGNAVEDEDAAEERAQPVTVTAVEARDVDVEHEYAGRVRGARDVEVRARVEGILEERLYREGEVVEAGTGLFRIDPEPFAARMEEARAQRQAAVADLEDAEREWQRISRMYERDAVSERERDTARSAVTLASAAVAVADSRVTLARLDYDYATVTAPVGGVTSLEAHPEGSLVERGALLTRIVQHDPVHVRFALPEGDAAIQRAARRAMMGDGGGEARQEATLRLPDGSEYGETGEIDFTASTIDPDSGTVSARAVFANPEGRVVPGQFVRIRVLLETRENVFHVPETVISEGADGPQLFVVSNEDRAEARAVELGPVVNGEQVVLEGLADGDRVVVNGHAGLQDGALVDVGEDD